MNHKKLLTQYFEILDIWNKKLKLIGLSLTKEKILAQSLDLLAFAKQYANLNSSCLIDIGAGAGLIGLIWGIEEKIGQIFFVERSSNRATFLKYASLTLKMKNEIFFGDIRNFAPIIKTEFDNVIITAQAFSTILFLLDSMKDNILTYNPKIILLKQSTVDLEIANALLKYDFDYKTESCEYGVKMIIRDIKIKAL